MNFFGAVMVESEQILETLRINLLNYMDSRSNLSVRAISKLSGVNRYFLSKLLSDDKHKDLKTYDFHQVILLLKYLNEKEGLKSTIESADSRLKDALLSIFESTCNSIAGDKKLYLIPEEYLYDFDYFMILSLATIKNLPLSTFELCLSSVKSYKIDKLIDENIIELDNGRISLVSKGDLFSIPVHIVELHIPELIKRYFSADNFGKDRCVLGYMYKGLSREGWKKIHALHTKFFTEAADILNDPENEGPIPVFSISVLDSFLDSKSIDQIVE